MNCENDLNDLGCEIKSFVILISFRVQRSMQIIIFKTTVRHIQPVAYGWVRSLHRLDVLQSLHSKTWKRGIEEMTMMRLSYDEW